MKLCFPVNEAVCRAVIDASRGPATILMAPPVGSITTDAASVVTWCKQFAVQIAVAPFGPGG